MKTHFLQTLVASFFLARALVAQDTLDSASPRRPASSSNRGNAQLRAGEAGDYASDIAVVVDAQAEALKQARDFLEETENPKARDAVQIAIKEMERSQKMLQAATKTPSELPAAVSAEQAAYQALLKIIPHDFRIQRSRNSRSSSSSGQPSSQQIDQLEMTPEEKRYETERQAEAPRTAQQKEQLEIADRLKQLAQRQQDLNERLRDLQTALQEARTEQEREEIKRQLKRLAEDERQMLSDVDELRQRVDQSPNASSMANARQQLDQARSDTQRASQELQNQSPTQALAAGARAQQTMQNLREDLRHQTSSQFSDQMRELRSQAREMAGQEDEVARALESLANTDHKSLDDSAPRQQLTQQMARQQSSLTNLLSKMQDLTEKAEATEPLLAQQLYDAIRRANQMHTENLLETGAQLLNRGFLTQAEGAERSARTNINELRQRVERAAESVLGNEADALRYARKELDDLAGQVQRELAGAGSNSNRLDGAGGRSNSLARATGQSTASANTNLTGGATSPAGASQTQSLKNSPSNSQTSSANGERPNGEGQRSSSAPGREAQAGETASAGQPGATGARTGNKPGANQRQTANNGAPGDSNEATEGSRQGANDGNAGGGNRLSELVRQMGSNNGGANNAGGTANGGPITGGDFVNWSDRMRDVEQVIESPELRNQLATARERLAGFRADYRAKGTRPDTNSLQIKVLGPMTEVRVRLQEDLARLQDSHSLVPLDHDPVPDNYADLVRKYYEKLGGGQ